MNLPVLLITQPICDGTLRTIRPPDCDHLPAQFSYSSPALVSKHSASTLLVALLSSLLKGCFALFTPNIKRVSGFPPPLNTPLTPWILTVGLSEEMVEALTETGDGQHPRRHVRRNAVREDGLQDVAGEGEGDDSQRGRVHDEDGAPQKKKPEDEEDV